MDKIKRKEYMRTYLKDYRKYYSWKQVSVTFSKEQYFRLRKISDEYRISVSQIVRQSAFHAIDRTEFLMHPKIEQPFNKLVSSLNWIGNNINQLTKYVHKNRHVTIDDLQKMRNIIAELEQTIETFIRNPQWYYDYQVNDKKDT